MGKTMGEDIPDVEKGKQDKNDEEEDDDDCGGCLDVAHLSFQCLAIIVVLVLFIKMLMDDNK